jgi:hypothetical protein
MPSELAKRRPEMGFWKPLGTARYQNYLICQKVTAFYSTGYRLYPAGRA